MWVLAAVDNAGGRSCSSPRASPLLQRFFSKCSMPMHTEFTCELEVGMNDADFVQWDEYQVMTTSMHSTRCYFTPLVRLTGGYPASRGIQKWPSTTQEDLGLVKDPW